MNWKTDVFRTYVKGSEAGDGKKPSVPKGTKLKEMQEVLSFEVASQNPCFGGLLQEGIDCLFRNAKPIMEEVDILNRIQEVEAKVQEEGEADDS